MSPALARLLAPLSLFAALTACSCLEELHVKPELTASELEKAKLGGVALDVVWKFKDCCPTGEQRDVALALQRRIGDLFEEVVAGKISLERYNRLVRAAQNAITEVILVCAAQGKRAPDPRLEEITRPEALQQAWRTCERVVEEIERAVNEGG